MWHCVLTTMHRLVVALLTIISFVTVARAVPSHSVRMAGIVQTAISEHGIAPSASEPVPMCRFTMTR